MSMTKGFFTIVLAAFIVTLFSGCNLFIDMFYDLDNPIEDTPSIPARIAVFYNTMPIFNGFDSFNVGVIASESGKSIVFTIRNIGDEPLILEGQPSIINSEGDNFSLSVNASTTINGGGSTTFTILFRADAGEQGERSATVSIGSNDSAANPYTFGIIGKVESTIILEPDIYIYYQNIDIESDMGSINLGSVNDKQEKQYVFHIVNMGNTDLHISEVLVEGDGFGLVEDVVASLAPSGTTNLKIFFSASTSGTYTGSIIIENNDPDESPFHIDVTVSIP